MSAGLLQVRMGVWGSHEGHRVALESIAKRYPHVEFDIGMERTSRGRRCFGIRSVLLKDGLIGVH